MAAPSVTYTFTNDTAADATEVNQNFTDIINGITDGTKDVTVNLLQSNGAATFNGNVTLGNAVGDDITFTGRVASDIDPKTAATSTLGDATQTWQALYLDNTTTDGGAIYFDGGSTEFIKANAAGTILEFGGFTDVQFEDGIVLTVDGTNDNITISSTDGVTILDKLTVDTLDAALPTAPSGTVAVFADGDGSAGVGIVAGTASGAFINFGDTSAAFAGQIVYLNAANALSFRTNGSATDRLYINSSGNVGIGTTSYTARLQVSGIGATGSTNAMTVENSGGLDILICSDSGAVLAPNIATQATSSGLQELWIDAANGNIKRITSSRRTKENITNIAGGLEEVCKLRPVDYTDKKTKSEGMGFIAEEVEAVLPKVAVSKDGAIESVNYAMLTPYLTKAVQELREEVLENRALIKSLQERIAALESK